MGRTGRGFRQDHRRPLNGKRLWAVKPVHDNSPQEEEPQVYDESDLNSPALPSTSEQHQTPGQAQKFAGGNRHPDVSRRNRASSRAKPRFIAKSEVGSSSKSELGLLKSEVGSSSGPDLVQLKSEVGSPSQSEIVHVKSDLGSYSESELGHLIHEVGTLDKVVETMDSEATSLSTKLGSLRLGDEEEDSNRHEIREVYGSHIQRADARSDSGEREDDAFARLEEVWSVVDEPELLEEQLSLDDQLQEDELLAVESIYGENVVILDKHKDLRVFQIHIHVETSDEITVTAQLNSSDDLKVKSEVSADFSYSFKVQHLPAIILTCVLPKSYPSHLPPYFVISVKWLDSTRISKLCSMLDSLWNEQKGQEVIYQWADWLQNSSLSYLGFNEGILLGPYSSTEVEDRRCCSGSLSPDIDVPFLRSYNDEKWHENFLKSLHECYICFSEYSGSDFVMLPCRHFFCCKCMQIYVNIHITEGTVGRLKCPDAKCGGMVPPISLRRFLSDEDFERWESLMLQITLDSMSDVQSCPRCETPCIEDEDQHAQCSKCFFSFCSLCRDKRHVGVACMTAEAKLQILQERQNSSQLQEDQKRKERNIINDILSVKEVLRDSKQCPSCKVAISRTEGCNKMVCSYCGEEFCYRCNQAIDGYEHFRDGTCELFPRQTIQEWEQRMNNRQEVGQLYAQMFEERGRQCPNCRQLNVKVDNNNHIFCWACQMHYCYLCRKIVRRSTEHFGPKGCKQHTAD